MPIAYYLLKLKQKGKNLKNFIGSTDKKDVSNQVTIQTWLICALLKNSFGSSTDTTLKNLQETIDLQVDLSCFPYEALNKRLNIESSFNDIETENLLGTNYSTKYSYLILSLFYPARDWKDNKYHEDHIFPKSEFTEAKLKRRGYSLPSIKIDIKNQELALRRRAPQRLIFRWEGSMTQLELMITRNVLIP